MAASTTAASAQRAIHARRARSRRGAPGSATAEGTRSSGDSEGRSEESEVTAGLVSNNRFAVLRSKEPAPGMQKEREITSPFDPSFRRERPITLPFQTDILPTDQTSSSGKIKDKSLAPTPPAVSCPKRPSIPRLAPRTPAKSTRVESNQQPSAPAAASVSPIKPQAQPSPLVLQADAQSVRSSMPPSASARTSPDFDTADPYLSLLAPQRAPALPSPPTSPISLPSPGSTTLPSPPISPNPLPSPGLATLPSPPVPPDPLPSPGLATLPSPPIPRIPLPIPGLATLPIHPSLDFKTHTSPKSCGPKPLQFSPPIPTTIDIFPSDDPMRHIVRTTNGRIFSIAAEIAAANERSTMRPVGNILVPGSSMRFGEVKGKIDSRKMDHERGEYVNSPEEMEDGSEGEDGEGEEWLGKDEGFWKQPLEERSGVRRGHVLGKREAGEG